MTTLLEDVKIDVESSPLFILTLKWLRPFLEKRFLVCCMIVIFSCAMIPTLVILFLDIDATAIFLNLDLTLVSRFHKAHLRWGIEKGPQYDGLIYLLSDFDVISRQRNFTYMLHREAALGAFRHQGLVPWEHSVPILVEAMPIGRLRQHLLGSLLILERRSSSDRGEAAWIIHRNVYVDVKHVKDLDSKHIPWPYLQISMFRIEKGFIVDSDVTSGFRFPTSFVLPPSFYAFEGILLPSYRCLPTVVSYIFDVDSCCLSEEILAQVRITHVAGTIDTTKSKRNLDVCVQCSRLLHFFPFVIRRLEVGANIVLEEVLNKGVRTKRYFHRTLCENVLPRVQVSIEKKNNSVPSSKSSEEE